MPTLSQGQLKRQANALQLSCEEFEEQTSSHHTSIHHPVPDFGKDFFTIVKVESMFVPKCKRQHASFNIQHGLMEKFTRDELRTKIEKNIMQIYKSYLSLTLTLVT